MSHTDSESDDEAHTANDQSSAVQLNHDTHEFKPKNYQHSTQDPKSAASPEERLYFPRYKKSASMNSETPRENSGLPVKAPQKEFYVSPSSTE